jgi:hypothetical protein
MNKGMSLIKRASTVAAYVLASAAILFPTGCASVKPRADITPHVWTRTSASGEVETRVGFVYGASKVVPYKGFLAESWDTISGPFQIYSFKSKRWFPQFRDHPWRTIATTLIYGAAYAVADMDCNDDTESETETEQVTVVNVTIIQETPPTGGDDGSGGA